MTPYKAGATKVVIALLTIAVILAAAFVLAVATSRSITETTTTTITATGQAGIVVEGYFDNHLLLFASRNVSGIISQYESDANVTWSGLPCYAGLYPVNGNGNASQLLGLFFDYTQPAFGFYSVFVGNQTRTTVTPMATGSIIVNSTFTLQAQSIAGNLTSTVSAQDSYTYSQASGTWLISNEFWHFLNFYSKGNEVVTALDCTGF